MDIFGVGGPELFFFLILGGIILGPRRIVSLAREGKKLMGQIQTLTRDISNELNREIDLMDIAEGKKPTPEAKEQEEEGEEILEEEEGEKLPDAYLKFREDFPDEGILDENQPENVTESDDDQPIKKRRRPVTVRSSALSEARKRQNVPPPQVTSDTPTS